jgi:hypothetical protein
MAKRWTKTCWRDMLIMLVSSHGIDHQRPHHMIRVSWDEVDWRLHWRTDTMDCSVGRMQSLHIVKIVRHRPHFHHSLSIIRCQPLYFRTPKKSNCQLKVPEESDTQGRFTHLF